MVYLRSSCTVILFSLLAHQITAQAHSVAQSSLRDAARVIGYRSQAARAAQTPDDAEIRALVQSFFGTLQKKDVEALMAMWSQRSPDLTASKQGFERLLAGVGQIELKEVAVKRLQVTGDRATVSLVVDIEALDGKAGKPAQGFGRLNRTLDLVTESNKWKLWRYVSSEEDLAARLAGAQTEEARNRLVSSNQELLTAELDAALLAQADRLSKQNLYSQALAILQLACDVASKLDDKPGIAGGLRRIGTTYFFQGRYEQANEYFQKSLALSESIGSKALIAAALDGIGRTQAEGGNLMAAADYYERSLKIYRELADRLGISIVLNNIGIANRKLGNLEESLRYYHESLKIAQDLDDKARIAIMLCNIGLVHSDQGNYVRALGYLRECLSMEKEVGDKRMTALALNGAGLVWEREGNSRHALEYFEQVLEMAEEMGNKPFIAGILINIGTVYNLEGDYKQALEAYQRSLSFQEEVGDKQEIAEAVTNIGEVYLKQGNAALALEYFARALKIEGEIGEKSRIGKTLNSSAEAYLSTGEFSRALEMAERSASIGRQTGDPELLTNSLIAAGNAHRAMGRLEKARQAFDAAIAALESLRNQVAGSELDRQQFMEARIAPYYAMADLLIDQGDPKEALAFAERAKARALTELLQSGKARITKAMTAGEKDQEQKLELQIASLNAQVIAEEVRNQPNQTRIADLKAELERSRLRFDAFQSELYAAHPELRIQRAAFSPITARDCAGLLPSSKTAILEFVVSEDRSLLFVLTKRKAAQQEPDLKVYRLGIKRKQLTELCRQFRQRLSNRDLVYEEDARKLYDLLIGPAAADLAGKASIIIVPDGPLWELPFQTLQQLRGRYLIEDHAVSLAPSLTALGEMSRRRHKWSGSGPRTTLLALGDPKLADQTRSTISQMMDADLSPLPAAAGMVKQIGALYGPAHSKVYVGAKATEDALKSEGPTCRILHIAAHGIVDNNSPMYSQVVLSRRDGSDDDGVLEAWEVVNLNLKADLVVLSGCETARGRIGAGEGMIGLSWAFFVAGCPSILASQWKVDASATAPLMVEFHRNLLSRMTKAEALRQAELKLLRTRHYAHPFDWAGFVVIGNGN